MLYKPPRMYYERFKSAIYTFITNSTLTVYLYKYRTLATLIYKIRAINRIIYITNNLKLKILFCKFLVCLFNKITPKSHNPFFVSLIYFPSINAF